MHVCDTITEMLSI